MIKRSHYANAWSNIVAILMFFLTFFTAYFISKYPLISAFIRAIVTLLVSTVIAKALVFVWNNSMSPDEWRLIVKGAPDLPKRADLLITEEEVAE
ncbi:MAG TPA: hypothetical protein PKZ69_08045 [Candidatus Cloacimonadota bacterium]|nr:hypothetical protein [Candidatus Cloacimonadota bacterium]HPK41561.1 hypothetical protein [Candidatus Cloacimonadota bacterium]